jgi:hypothetical protein
MVSIGKGGSMAEKWQSIFGNDRFWEYVAQIQMDRRDPADILEPWMKKNHPEYFEEEIEQA